ncbi:MAG: hypothetical protein SFV54_27165 [Bryobacteraceae bacterium]|nr:hypothetical protein [Bryobacteraceae bacterium]
MASRFLEIKLGRLPFWFDLSLSPATVPFAGAFTVLGVVIAGVLPAMKITRGMGWRLKQNTAGAGGLQFGGAWTVAMVAVTVAFSAIVYIVRSTTRGCWRAALRSSCGVRAVRSARCLERLYAGGRGDRAGIYYIDDDPGWRPHTVRRFDPATETSTVVARLDQLYLTLGLEVSPEHKTILTPATARVGGDLMVVDGL